MKTTLNEIYKHNPCEDGWNKLLSSLGKTKADDEPLDLMHILGSNGIENALWALKCFDYKDYCLFLADIAESVLHIYENQYDNSDPRKATEAIRAYKAGKITRDELRAYADAADDTAFSTSAADVIAFDAATAAARAAADDAYASDGTAAHAVAASAAYAAASTASAEDDAAVAIIYAVDASYTAVADASKQKWQEIEQLFIEHFGE